MKITQWKHYKLESVLFSKTQWNHMIRKINLKYHSFLTHRRQYLWRVLSQRLKFVFSIIMFIKNYITKRFWMLWYKTKKRMLKHSTLMNCRVLNLWKRMMKLKINSIIWNSQISFLKRLYLLKMIELSILVLHLSKRRE